MGIETDIRRTRELYGEMRNVLDLSPQSVERVVTRVSAWSPLQQIAHISKSNRWILSSVVAIVSDRKRFEETGPTRPVGRLVLRTGIIPRGIGKAPSVAIPDDDVSVNRLEAELGDQERNLGVIDAHVDKARASRQSFKHPYFGHFTPKQWVRFVRIHTNHHMKIVREILAAGDL